MTRTNLYVSLLEQAILPAADVLRHTAYMSTLRWYRNAQWMTPSHIEALQRTRLAALLENASRTHPFYRECVDAQRGDPVDQLQKLPIINKRIIREWIDVVPKYKDSTGHVVVRSSGSSGVQGEVWLTPKEHSMSQAIQTFLWEWGGYRHGLAMLQTGMTFPRTGIRGAKDLLLNVLYVSAFHLDEGSIEQNLLRAKNKGVRIIGGYASSLYEYATVALRKGVDLQVDGVLSWGDKLFPHYRSAVERAFGTRATDLYGLSEGLMIAGECEHGRHHIVSPHVFIEIVDDSGDAVKMGERGRVIATRLDATFMPVIRYDTGDVAALDADDAPCPCGRSFPRLSGLIGRDTDVVRLPSGRRMIVHFFTAIFEHVPEIRQFQIVQTALDAIEVRYIPGPACTSKILYKIEQEILVRLGEVLNITFIQVDHIPASPSGKPQIVLSRL